LFFHWTKQNVFPVQTIGLGFTYQRILDRQKIFFAAGMDSRLLVLLCTSLAMLRVTMTMTMIVVMTLAMLRVSSYNHFVNIYFYALRLVSKLWPPVVIQLNISNVVALNHCFKEMKVKRNSVSCVLD
jgi:hypothetical protein